MTCKQRLCYISLRRLNISTEHFNLQGGALGKTKDTDERVKGKKLTLHVDHINGDHTDNRLENLRFLCPNCHSQTKTWGNKMKRKY